MEATIEGTRMSKPLVVATDHAPSEFDMEQPRGFLNSTSADLAGSLYDQLTSPRAYLDDAGIRRTDWHNLEARLAEAWWYSESGLDCTVRIRRGVYSSAGNELTAGDVKWGYDRAFAMRDVGKWMARISSVQEAESVEVLDRYTVVFHQTAPNPALPRLFAMCAPSVYDSAQVRSGAGADDEWGKRYLPRNPAGFGPYRLVSRGDEETVLAANERYFRGSPAIDEVRVRPFAERGEAIEALLAGTVDLVNGVSLAEAQNLGGRPGVRIAVGETPPGVTLQIDPSEAPFDDPRVRQAVALAVPYQEFIQTAYQGTVRRWRSVLQPETPGYLDEWPYEEDVDRARTLLVDAGFPNGFSTRLVAMPGTFLGPSVQVLKAGLARVGIDFTVENATGGGALMVTLPKANLAPLMLRGGGISGRGARAYEACYALFHDYAPGRMRLLRYAYENPEFYDALAKISTAGHGAPWLDAVHRTQRIIAADAVVIPICGSRYYVAHRDSLDGYRWYPDNTLSFFDLRWA